LKDVEGEYVMEMCDLLYIGYFMRISPIVDVTMLNRDLSFNRSFWGYTGK